MAASPTVEAVLDSSKRLTIWQRKQATTGRTGKKAFDYSFATGYDFAAMGWKVDEVSLRDLRQRSVLQLQTRSTRKQRRPRAKAIKPLRESQRRRCRHGHGRPARILSCKLSQVPGQGKHRRHRHQADSTNTRIHSNSNTGHEFTDILTEQERKAIIEYLKTL